MKIKEIRCKYCRVKSLAKNMLNVPGGSFCTYKHLIAWAIKNKAKGLNKLKKFEKSEDLIRKNVFRGSDIRWQHTQTQKSFNKLRKLQEMKWFNDRGLEPECISCGKKNMDWCNGHFKTRGSQGALRYDPINSYLQCNRYCNMALSGNINGNKTTRGYLKGLVARFGEVKTKEIISYCEKDRTKSWSCDELIEMRKRFNKEIKTI